MKKLFIRLQIIVYKLRIWLAERPHRPLTVLLTVALVIAVIGGILFAPDRKVNAPAPAVPKEATQVITDQAGEYSIKLPDDWVLQTDVAAEATSSEVVAFAPKTRIATYKEQTGNSGLLHTTIALYHTTDTPKDWFDKQHFGTPAVSQDILLPGKTTFAAKIITADYSEEHYVVSHNGVLLHFTFHRITKTYQPDQTDDFSTDLGTFDKVFTSLSFLK